MPMITFLAKKKMCLCYLKSDQLSLSIQSCREALDIQKDPHILCDRAEAYINSEMFDDGRYCFSYKYYRGLYSDYLKYFEL